MTVLLPPVDQPPNCAMFQPSGSSNRSANSNNNRRLTRGLGTSHFFYCVSFFLFFGLVPWLLCGWKVHGSRFRATRGPNFFPFISLRVARFGWSSLRWPALHFLQIQLILQDEDNITVPFRNESAPNIRRPKLPVNEGHKHPPSGWCNNYRNLKFSPIDSWHDAESTAAKFNEIRWKTTEIINLFVDRVMLATPIWLRCLPLGTPLRWDDWCRMKLGTFITSQHPPTYSDSVIYLKMLPCSLQQRWTHLTRDAVIKCALSWL